MFDLTGTGIATFLGAFLAAFGVNACRSLLRLNGQIKYWKAKAGENGSIGSTEVGDPLEEMESRLSAKLHEIETRQGCEFSEMFQGHLKCTHDVLSNHHMTTRELLSAIDDHIVGMAQLAKLLKSLNGRIKIDEEPPTDAED